MSTNPDDPILEVLNLFSLGENITIAKVHDQLKRKASSLVAEGSSVTAFILNMETEDLLVALDSAKAPWGRKYKLTKKGIALREHLMKTIGIPAASLII